LSEPAPLLPDVGAVAFIRPQHLLLAGDLELAQCPPDGHARAAQRLRQLIQDGVGLVVQQLLQPLESLRVQQGRRSALVRSWGQRTGLASQSQQTGDEGQADAETSSQVPEGAFPLIDCLGHPVAQVHRVGSHKVTSTGDKPPFGIVLCAQRAWEAL